MYRYNNKSLLVNGRNLYYSHFTPTFINMQTNNHTSDFYTWLRQSTNEQ